MRQFVNRLFRLEPGEWPKLVQFGLFGFLLQMGMGIGFSAGDAAFLSNVGADSLPIIFLLTPVVMLFYTIVFSYLMVRFSIGHIVDLTLALLIAGGAALWALLNADLPLGWEANVYFALKLYLAVWYIGLYTLFWNFTDTYFDIQDAKRLFPLFAAFCALGTATGAIFVSVFAGTVPMHYFFLAWAVIAFATAPVARFLQSRWVQIAESDLVVGESSGSAASKLAGVGRAFRNSRYAMVLALTLFVTLLMTNLAEFQYSKVLQEGRSEAELASLLGALYAAANIFNMLVCLLLFNRLVARFGVRNVALIQPLTYFAVFGYFFLEGGPAAALAAFFAYHGVLTSIQYNNENLLFNAVPSQVKRPLRTVIEGMCEPVASLVAGGFLLYAANILDMRELSGIGVIIGLVLLAVVIALRQQYPAAMAANMRRGWLNFGDRTASLMQFDGQSRALLETTAARDDAPAQVTAKRLLIAQEQSARSDNTTDSRTAPVLPNTLLELNPEERDAAISKIGESSDPETIPEILLMACELAPRDRRAVAANLAEMGETAIPRLTRAIGDRAQPYRLRSIAARALVELSYAQFSSQLDRIVQTELRETGRLLQSADLLDRNSQQSSSMALLARAQRERVGLSIDFALELLSLGRKLPDADLLIVSLHSTNAKVRGNAIEAIENGVDHLTFGLLRSLLHGEKSQRSKPHDSGDVGGILLEALAEGRPIEAAAAADVLEGKLSKVEFERRIQSLMDPKMSPLLRDTLKGFYGLNRSGEPGMLQVLNALSQSPLLGKGPLHALLALAKDAYFAEPMGPAKRESVGGIPVWILQSEIETVAARYPDLALVLLRSQIGHRYAA